MKINTLKIDNINGIEHLDLQFNPGINIICGPNGIGKTTILECIAHAFVHQRATIIRRKANATNAEFSINIDIAESVLTQSFTISSFEPESYSEIWSPFLHHSKYLLSLKSTRDFSYTRIDAIHRDVTKDLHVHANEASTGVGTADVKSWLVSRIINSYAPDMLTSEQIHNLEHTKKYFSFLDNRFSYSKMTRDTYDILINTPTGEIYYEYLSSGFKACLAMLLGITKEIELRFTNPRIKIEDFSGVILVDEVELHLHPEWQAKTPEILKAAFPSAQIILTTHSPHVIQSAQAEDIIALEKQSDSTTRRSLPASDFGFQGWTVEEVLKDVMGMPDTRTPAYHEAMKAFENAIDQENYEEALSAYSQLDELLHPENHLRKLLSFQLGALKG